MASAKVLLFRHKKFKDGSHPIVLQIIKDRQRKFISLGHCKVEHWTEAEKLPNNKHPDSSSLQKLIMKKRYEAMKVINELDEKDEQYTIEDIISKIRTNQINQTLFNYMEELISRLERTSKIGNARVYENTLNVFKKFRKNKDIDFKLLNYKILQEFREYLLEEGRKENTISIHLRTLRAVYNSAIKENLVPKSYYPFESFKIKSEKTIKRAITKEEINKIRKLKITIGSELDKARDFFLFSFNMRGMSFIDMAYLKTKDIRNSRLTYSRKKTGQKFSIKLTEEAFSIIRKYCDQKDPDKYVFHVIQRKNLEYLDYRNAMRLTNKKLKTIGDMIESTIPLSTYVSRHTWATVAKRSGYSTSIISEGLGHDSEKTTQIYLDSFEKDVLDDANEDITS